MNKYEILGVVGEGAYGIVLKCRNKDTGDILAIKKFKDTEDDEIILKNTQREIKMLKLLKYEHVVDLKEAFKRKGRIYLVFEFVDRNLLEVLEEKPQGLDAEFIRKIMFQLVKSLDFCHKHNVIHRDIKPENLLINNTALLKLCDFGFARYLPQKGEQLTDYVATRWYRAPELILGDQNYGSPIDMWAVGCIMGELIDGQPLFPGENEVDQLYQIQKVLGGLTDQQKEILNKNPRFIGVKVPEVKKPETLDRVYLGKMDKKALQFMKAVLRMDPSQRLNCQQALQHPYFDSIGPELRKSQLNNEIQSKSDVNQKQSHLFNQKTQMQNGVGSNHNLINPQNNLINPQNNLINPQNQINKNTVKVQKTEKMEAQVYQNINFQNINLYNLNIQDNIQQKQYNFTLSDQKNGFKKPQLIQQKNKNPPFGQNLKFNHTQYIKTNQYKQLYNQIDSQKQFRDQKQQQMLPILNMKKQGFEYNKNQTFHNNFNPLNLNKTQNMNSNIQLGRGLNLQISSLNNKGQKLNKIYKPLKLQAKNIKKY